MNNLKEEFINKEIKELKDYLTDEEIKGIKRLFNG